MKKYRILCLTDHEKHSKENSLYALVSAISQHHRCEQIVIASRSYKLNALFFFKNDFRRLLVSQVNGNFTFDVGRKELFNSSMEINPAEYDIIFLRLPRPISDEFLMSLEEEFGSKCIINKPSGIISCSNKAALLNFQEVCPPMKLCYSIEEILEFSRQHDIVLKPLKEYGGKGIIRIKNNVLNDGRNDHSVLEYLHNIESIISEEGFLAMKYLENVNQGDKRLIVVGGEVLAAALRIPPVESWLCNVAMGGTSLASQPDEKEMEIISVINPYLSDKGILIYGADTLVDDNGERTLSEINALSIGGFPQAERQTGKPIINITTNKLFSHADIHFRI
ncbi:MAG: glutathione synthetase [Bacteroidia bacterium]|nr:glutathione synthetase [Bacteroidia bacterium]